jgi:hypothetical protein
MNRPEAGRRKHLGSPALRRPEWRNLLSGVQRAICWQCFLALSSSELPAFDGEVVLGMFLAVFGFASRRAEAVPQR